MPGPAGRVSVPSLLWTRQMEAPGRSGAPPGSSALTFETLGGRTGAAGRARGWGAGWRMVQ